MPAGGRHYEMSMNMKTLLGILVVVALGVGGFMAARYTQRVGEELTSGSEDAQTAESHGCGSSRTPRPFPS